jgi:hypothetical protein
MGLIPSGFSSSDKAAKAHHLSHALLTFFPQTSAQFCGHTNCDLGPSQNVPFRLQGLHLRQSRIPEDLSLASPREHPLLDFYLLMA